MYSVGVIKQNGETQSQVLLAELVSVQGDSASQHPQRTKHPFFAHRDAAHKHTRERWLFLNEDKADVEKV